MGRASPFRNRRAVRIAQAALADALQELDGLYALAARSDRSLALAHAHTLHGHLALATSMLSALGEESPTTMGVRS